MSCVKFLQRNDASQAGCGVRGRWIGGSPLPGAAYVFNRKEASQLHKLNKGAQAMNEGAQFLATIIIRTTVGPAAAGQHAAWSKCRRQPSHCHPSY